LLQERRDVSLNLDHPPAPSKAPLRALGAATQPRVSRPPTNSASGPRERQPLESGARAGAAGPSRAAPHSVRSRRIQAFAGANNSPILGRGSCRLGLAHDPAACNSAENRRRAEPRPARDIGTPAAAPLPAAVPLASPSARFHCAATRPHRAPTPTSRAPFSPSRLSNWLIMSVSHDIGQRGEGATHPRRCCGCFTWEAAAGPQSVAVGRRVSEMNPDLRFSAFRLGRLRKSRRLAGSSARDPGRCPPRGGQHADTWKVDTDNPALSVVGPPVFSRPPTLPAAP